MNDAYAQLCRDFSWNLPGKFNLGSAIAAAGRRDDCAINVVDALWQSHEFTFAQIDSWSDQLAHILLAKGARPGCHAAILLPPSLEALLAYLAAQKCGMITMPLAGNQQQACTEQLAAVASPIVLTSFELAEEHAGCWDEIDGLTLLPIRSARDVTPGASLLDLLQQARGQFAPAWRSASEPGFLSFTSGSQGRPKGVIQPQSIVPGIIPALQFTQLPRQGDLVWSTFDWNSLGGLLVALGSLYCGASVLVHDGPQLSPGKSMALMAQFGVTRLSIAPTALRMLRLGARSAKSPHLTSLTSGGEKLDGDTRDWVTARFGIECSELYGLTECSGVMGSGYLVAPKPGALGKPAPGMDVCIVDEDGKKQQAGETGIIAIRAPHPAMFAGYWRDDGATQAKFLGDLLLTGDLGVLDDEGYFTYVGRADDVIMSSGHRIGPDEVEDACRSHPSISLCAAIGVPDALCGEAIVLWAQAEEPFDAAKLEEELMGLARSQLPPYQRPSRIRFVDAIPLTANGKVNRRLVREGEAG